MILKNRVLLLLIVFFVFFFTDCSKKDRKVEKSDDKIERGAKPETGPKPVTPLSLICNFEKISDGQVLGFDTAIEIRVKIIPVPEELDNFIQISADLNFTASLKKTGISESGIGFFDFRMEKLSAYIPGPGINVDYNSKDKEKYLNPQIRGLDFFVGKDIPVKISRFGGIEIDEADFLDKNEILRPRFKRTYIDQIKSIVGYFFINFPQSEIKPDKPFYSDIPFNGQYSVHSLTGSGEQILITPVRTVLSDKSVIASSIKGWLLIQKDTGIIVKNFLELIEKKYMTDSGIKSVIEKKILVEIKPVAK